MFQAKSGRTYDFNDIDYGFRTMFLSYLYGDKKYNVNTAAKCINTLVTILRAAEAEGYHSNVKCLSRQFRAKRMEVDNVYLTKEELRAMMEADISHLSKQHELARDIFMVGVYTAQRVSDYNNIARENIVAKAAGVDSPVTVETTSGGVVSFQTRPKYELVHTHTARRTGATLMYLAGMDAFNICSVTGHSSIAMLKKYIKASELECANMIRSDAAFAVW